ncbi:MAG: very short patch repair endonuclease [Dehalococcoidia bacterium]|nr:very short patch repair endonuclease [Dehalococcoidia bacterium]
MTDNVSPEVRSRTMRAVRSANTSIEWRLRRALWRAGVRGYRVAPPAIDGAPDLVFPTARLAVFVDGCFWHGCPQHCRRPSSRQEYWHRKIDRTIARDRATTARLEANGWTVLRIWEHTVKDAVDDAVRVIRETRDALRGRLPARHARAAPEPVDDDRGLRQGECRVVPIADGHALERDRVE